MAGDGDGGSGTAYHLLSALLCSVSVVLTGISISDGRLRRILNYIQTVVERPRSHHAASSPPYATRSSSALQVNLDGLELLFVAYQRLDLGCLSYLSFVENDHFLPVPQQHQAITPEYSSALRLLRGIGLVLSHYSNTIVPHNLSIFTYTHLDRSNPSPSYKQDVIRRELHLRLHNTQISFFKWLRHDIIDTRHFTCSLTMHNSLPSTATALLSH